MQQEKNIKRLPSVHDLRYINESKVKMTNIQPAPFQIYNILVNEELKVKIKNWVKNYSWESRLWSGSPEVTT